MSPPTKNQRPFLVTCLKYARILAAWLRPVRASRAALLPVMMVALFTRPRRNFVGCTFSAPVFVTKKAKSMSLYCRILRPGRSLSVSSGSGLVLWSARWVSPLCRSLNAKPCSVLSVMFDWRLVMPAFCYFLASSLFTIYLHMPLLVSDSTRTSSLISGGVCFILFCPVHSFVILVLFAPYFLRFPWFICFILISTFVQHVEEKYIYITEHYDCLYCLSWIHSMANPSIWQMRNESYLPPLYRSGRMKQR